MIKVILMTSYGENNFPREVEEFAQKIMKKDKNLWRINIDLIRKIESLPISFEGIENLSGITKIYGLKDEEGIQYFYPNSSTKSISYVGSLKVANVDETRPWCIETYDGYEYVKYLDEYVKISEKNNFYVLRGDSL